MTGITVRIHALVIGVTRLGPGRRAGIWFQGCPFRCRGCITPGALSFAGGTEMDVTEVIRALRRSGDLDGVTCSGGEPFAQPEALAAILDATRCLRYGNVVFSGYQLEYLRSLGLRDPAIAKALGLIDVLVDGIYIEERNRGHTWMRGSDNQRIHFLTDRSREEGEYFERYDRESFEIRPTVVGEAMLIGVPSRRAGDVWNILGATGRSAREGV